MMQIWGYTLLDHRNKTDAKMCVDVTASWLPCCHAVCWDLTGTWAGPTITAQRHDALCCITYMECCQQGNSNWTCVFLLPQLLR